MESHVHALPCMTLKNNMSQEMRNENLQDGGNDQHIPSYKIEETSRGIDII